MDHYLKPQTENSRGAADILVDDGWTITLNLKQRTLGVLHVFL
jgi:hypothetical protein